MEAAKTFTDAFIEHAKSEHRLLGAELRQLQEQLDSLAEEQARLRADAESLTLTIREIEDLLGLSPQLRLEIALPERVGGKALRDIAVSILEAAPADAVFHYREWYELVTNAGYSASGQNPVATFLAQISQDPRVERVGNKSGRYKLKHSASSA